MIKNEREWRNLYELSFLFERMQPWEVLQENEMIAIKDPEHDLIGYCVITKTKSGQFSLVVYIGDEGLKSYRQFLRKDNYSNEEPQYFKALNGRNALTIEFKNKEEVADKQTLMITQLGYRFKLKKKWPIFMKLQPYKVPAMITEPFDCDFLSVVLERLIELTHQRLDDLVYPTKVSDELINYYDYDATCHFQHQQIPNRLQQLRDLPIVYQNDIMIYKVKKCPVRPVTFELIHFLLTEPMQEKDETPFYPIVFGIVEQQSGEVLFADLVGHDKAHQQVLLDEISRLLVQELKCRPLKFVSQDDEIIQLLTDFCEKTGIELLKEPLRVAHKFMEHILNQSIEVEETNILSDDQVDLILETTKQICDVITTSSCFCKSLSEQDKEQFKYTIELLHIMMISQFQELPECWTPENFEYVCRQMMPKIYPKERLPIIYEMIREYVTVVGEANVMPNYKKFLMKLNKPLSIL